MTAIVGKPGLMVSDSMLSGETTKSSGVKIHRVHGYLVGFAGDMGHWQRLLHCASRPKKPTVKTLIAFCNERPDMFYEHVDVLVCTTSKVFEIDGGSVSEVPVGVVGSGEAVARGYLEARPGDVEGAVKAACKHSLSCLPPIRKISL